MVSVDVKHHVYLVPYYGEYTTTQQVMHTVYYSETLHMEDRCLYATPHYSETLHMEDRCLYATLQ